MMFDWAEWGPPLAVIAVGMIGSFVWVRRITGEDSYTQHVERRGNEADSRQGKQRVLDDLRRLEHERHKLTPADYEEERSALIARGAAYIERLEEVERNAMPTKDELVDRLTSLRDEVGTNLFEEALSELGLRRSKDQNSGQMGAEWKGALYTLAAVAVGALMFTMAADESRLRIGDEPMTGTAANAPALNSAKRQLEAKLAANTNDLATLNQLTQLSLGDNDLGAAQNYNQRALGVSPNDRDARMYRAVLAGLIGMYDRSLSYLDELIAEDPNFAAALSYKGIIAVEAGQPEVAIPALERAIALQGSHPALEGALRRARSGEVPSRPATQAPLGEAHTPTADDALALPVASGSISLAEGLSAPGSDATLFIAVRDPAGGPPLAALKRSAQFPQDFEVTTADAIAMGGQKRRFPDEVKLVIRVDLDGNAMTKEEGAPSLETIVKRGTDGLSLTLN